MIKGKLINIWNVPKANVVHEKCAVLMPGKKEYVRGNSTWFPTRDIYLSLYIFYLSNFFFVYVFCRICIDYFHGRKYPFIDNS